MESIGFDELLQNMSTFIHFWADSDRVCSFPPNFGKVEILAHSRSSSLILALLSAASDFDFWTHVLRGKCVLAHSRSFSLILALGSQASNSY